VNAKAKGTRNEHRSMAIFEAAGYQTMRSAASLSVFDFIAWNHEEIVYCQVSTRDWKYGLELDALEQTVVPPNGRKVLHRWRYGCSEPDVRVL
jgi:Holliday junction resolvase